MSAREGLRMVREELAEVVTGIRHANAALAAPDTQLRLFGKPHVKGKRRMGVAIARGKSIDEARAKAKATADAVEVNL